LDAYSKASRLSFFLWNSIPDPLLLAAAESGALNDREEIARQVERMVASPRIEQGVRAFFDDMLHLDAIATVAKDVVLFPKFDSLVAADAREQTLLTITDRLVRERGDYRDIFTTKKTYLTRALASIYRVPLATNAPNGSPDAWQAYEFEADDPRAGILTHLSFLALHSHPGRSSPTLRGQALRELLLCQKVPAPPGDVDFTLVNDTQTYKTARERLTAHSEEPMCAGCHKITDPMGLALERFDGVGAFRERENGAEIDTAGALDGVEFQDAAGLGHAVANHPAVTSCLVDRMLSYALGRKPARDESDWAADLRSGFADDGHDVPALMSRIASSETFY
ncbi:MAG: DUF1592 domain-containing protein, partial [Rhodospirillaceae bacterium]